MCIAHRTIYYSLLFRKISSLFPLEQTICTTINSITSLLRGGGSNANVNIIFFQKDFTNPTTSVRNSTTEYYFQTSYNLNINNITSGSGSIADYCPNRYPLTRTQRYFSACTSSGGCNTAQYQTYNGCSLRDTFAYTGIPSNFFNAQPSSLDGATNFAAFDSSTNVTCTFYWSSLIKIDFFSIIFVAITCTGFSIRRVFYRFNYSSIDNTISTVEAFVLRQTSSGTTRITIEWNDIAVTAATNATIPRRTSCCSNVW